MKNYTGLYRGKPLLLSQTLYWFSKQTKILSYKVKCIDQQFWKLQSLFSKFAFGLLRIFFVAPEIRLRKEPGKSVLFEEEYHELKQKIGPSLWLK